MDDGSYESLRHIWKSFKGSPRRFRTATILVVILLSGICLVDQFVRPIPWLRVHPTRQVPTCTVEEYEDDPCGCGVVAECPGVGDDLGWP
jgi:hypothetical protein